MTKKEWREQADAYLHQILELLKCYEEVTYIGQESYKGDFFKVFAEAYRNGYCAIGERFDVKKGHWVPCKAQRPRISGEAIWSFAERHKWVHAEMTGEEKRYSDIQMVKTWWDEWTYAWKRPKPRRRYVRRTSEGEAGRPINDRDIHRKR
jgi:hypothetical protein